MTDQRSEVFPRKTRVLRPVQYWYTPSGSECTTLAFISMSIILEHISRKKTKDRHLFLSAAIKVNQHILKESDL